MAFYHLIRTGKKLGTRGQKARITTSVREEFISTEIVNILGYIPGKLAAVYRVFTGKPMDTLLEAYNENNKMKIKITQDIILNNLEYRINKGINKKENFPFVVEDIAVYSILKAKEIKIIPGNGIIFPQATGKSKSYRGL